GDVPIHVAGVDDVSSVFDDLPVMLFYPATLGQPRHFHQQFFIAKRDFEIIVSPGSQAKQTVVEIIAQTTNQDNGNISCAGVLLDQATEFNAVEDGHHHIANYHVGFK